MNNEEFDVFAEYDRQTKAKIRRTLLTIAAFIAVIVLAAIKLSSTPKSSAVETVATTSESVEKSNTISKFQKDETEFIKSLSLYITAKQKLDYLNSFAYDSEGLKKMGKDAYIKQFKILMGYHNQIVSIGNTVSNEYLNYVDEFELKTQYRDSFLGAIRLDIKVEKDVFSGEYTSEKTDRTDENTQRMLLSFFNYLERIKLLLKEKAPKVAAAVDSLYWESLKIKPSL